MALLFEFAREYQIRSLRVRCMKFLSEDMAKTHNCNPRLLDLVVLASEHSLTDHLEKLIPRVAQQNTAAIRNIHGKVDHGVLAAIYLAKSQRSEKILTSLPQPSSKPIVVSHALVPSGSPFYCNYGTCTAVCEKLCSICDKCLCPAHESTTCVQWPAEELRCGRCKEAYADGCACGYSCPTDLIAHMKIA